MSTSIVKLHDRKGCVQFKGVEFQENRLAISTELAGDALRDLLRFLIAVDGCSLFWIADLLNHIKATHENGEIAAIECAQQFSNPDRLLDAMALCAGMKERRSLSFAFHREAYIESGCDSTLALEWMDKASAEGWTVAQMRGEIRRSRAVTPVERSEASITVTGDISRLRRRLALLLAERPIEEWSMGELTALNQDLKPVASLAFQISELLGECQR